ncbi:hypothetical protein [Chryseobacterium sp.]|uniref:hypothetical protein n=1 Tax=Chryseobacterium sp. TaxID=1871047 RepID=UPI000EE08EB6|nr:hypothetical protein [Chryseobacterium sp.]HCA06483.1 hypothetical protein [Chryseobacterium sp.]
MMNRVPKVKKVMQDQNSEAWKQLCLYIDKVAEEGHEEFEPRKGIGSELFQLIETLPKSIAKLKKVKRMMLYGSHLKQIPPEIGEMESLEEFIPYTSYNLMWFPYEIIYCKNLKSSTVSTRALYGNYKFRTHFPNLYQRPLRYYDSEIVKCSMCKNEIPENETDQYWVSLPIATDVLPLLVNVCSESCKAKIPQPSELYVQFPHKGGEFIKQPKKY